MERLVVCTGNAGKLDELRRSLPQNIELLTPAEVGLREELPETGHTLEANALQKARYACGHCGMACLADDSGLEVRALNGAPGVDSAFYGGPQKDPQANIERLLSELGGKRDRRARFRTVLALVLPVGVEHLFEGVVDGRIAESPRGSRGFGYDPVFVPEGSSRTFAEMTAEEKNRISHRGRAVAAFIDHLAVS